MRASETINQSDMALSIRNSSMYHTHVGHYEWQVDGACSDYRTYNTDQSLMAVRVFGKCGKRNSEMVRHCLQRACVTYVLRILSAKRSGWVKLHGLRRWMRTTQDGEQSFHPVSDAIVIE